MSRKKIIPFCSKAFLAFVVLMQFSLVSLADQTLVYSGDVDVEDLLNPEGDCVSEDGTMFDMKNLRHFSNQSIKTRVNDSDYILTIDFELVEIVEVGKEDDGTLIFHIPYSVYETDWLGVDEESLDVLVNFAELDHEDYVYWRESYVNKAYWQGLFKFDGNDLVAVCSGAGGVTVTRW